MPEVKASNQTYATSGLLLVKDKRLSLPASVWTYCRREKTTHRNQSRTPVIEAVDNHTSDRNVPALLQDRQFLETLIAYNSNKIKNKMFRKEDSSTSAGNRVSEIRGAIRKYCTTFILRN
jgi:catalase